MEILNGQFFFWPRELKIEPICHATAKASVAPKFGAEIHFSNSGIKAASIPETFSTFPRPFVTISVELVEQKRILHKKAPAQGLFP